MNSPPHAQRGHIAHCCGVRHIAQTFTNGRQGSERVFTSEASLESRVVRDR